MNNEHKIKEKLRVIDLIYVALFAALMAICSWISIPTTIPFTLQTFGVFVAVGLLGGRRGTLAVLVYILLGAVGVPVFASFTGGIGILLGSTGGYIVGFLFSALVMWAIGSLFGTGTVMQIVSMLVGLFVCYAFGTAWFMNVYMGEFSMAALRSSLAWCVFPYIIPDLVKIALAYVLTNRLKRHVA